MLVVSMLWLCRFAGSGQKETAMWQARTTMSGLIDECARLAFCYSLEPGREIAVGTHDRCGGGAAGGGHISQRLHAQLRHRGRPARVEPSLSQWSPSTPA